MELNLIKEVMEAFAASEYQEICLEDQAVSLRLVRKAGWPEGYGGKPAWMAKDPGENPGAAFRGSPGVTAGGSRETGDPEAGGGWIGHPEVGERQIGNLEATGSQRTEDLGAGGGRIGNLKPAAGRNGEPETGTGRTGNAKTGAGRTGNAETGAGRTGYAEAEAGRAGNVETEPNRTGYADEGLVRTDRQASVPGMEPYIVRAPMAGIFYVASAPGEAPFVEPGTRVEKGDVIGLLEAMKVISEITAPVSGVIERICLEDAAFAEFDSPLFEMQVGTD
ncbi:MAG: hypothetical protein IJ860_03245 [Eubacterium sp.]|nr:hypothetical protein [Eubacterium sp.]